MYCYVKTGFITLIIIHMTTKFKSKKLTITSEQKLMGTPEKIFPLLCPTRQYDWIASWQCELIHSLSGKAELDCVFTTNFPGDVKETWVIDRYEPNSLIQYVRFSESRIIRYKIELISNHDQTTTALWQQTIVSRNNDGNLYIDNFMKCEFEHEIKTLEKMLNHYLQTNKRLELSEVA